MASIALTPETTTEAQSAAMRNFSANLRALTQSQPDLISALRRPEQEWTWTYARDGSLTALSPAGQWLADCSLPARAAANMLKSLELRGNTSCLLAPVHAAQIRRALDLLTAEQALLVVVPDESFLPIAFHCDNFAAELESHRLFFAVGPDWPSQLASLFLTYPGLPTPTLFLRPPTTPEPLSASLIESAQQLFKDANAAHAASLAAMTSRPAPRPTKLTRICVVAGSIFRLWSDAGPVLADVLSADPSAQVRRFDPDRPTTASNLALATVARECDALVAPNFARSDTPVPLLPPEIPWLTWATTSTVPDGRRSALHDRLLLTDSSLAPAAISAGWHKSQVSVAAWPAVSLPAPSAPHAITLIANTAPLRTDINEDTFEFSSHMVLWELIASELHSNPLLAAGDPAAYLTSRMQRLTIGPEAFNRTLFLDHLITPAYHQGVARLLLSAALPLRLFGRGWSDLPEFAAHAAGPIHSRTDLLRAASAASALIHPAPGQSIHPIDSFPRPVLSPTATRPDAFLHNAKVAHTSPTRSRPSTTPPLTPSLVLTLLRKALAA